MHARGAVIWEQPGKYEVTDLEIDDPRAGEIRVKMVASGLCHSDDHVATGDIPAGRYPCAGGHEGAGIVMDAGPNNKGIKEGDHVVFSFLPSCGHCRWCATGQQNLCDLGADITTGARPGAPEDFRIHLPDGTGVGQMLGLSTFLEVTTVSADSAIKIDKDLPLEKMCLLGCGVGTGWGSATNSAEVKPGHTVIVMGVGGVGINAVQGAAHVGAAHVIAVDHVAFKRAKALELGATHAVASMEEATELAKQFTNGQGADSAIITVGLLESVHVSQAMASIRKAGTVVVTSLGNTTKEDLLPISLAELTYYQKRLQGSLFGATNANWDIHNQIEMYRAGVLKLDELITKTYSLDEVAQGFEDMHDGTIIRGVIEYK